MRNRYDNSPGKEASMAKTRQMRHEAEHAAKNAFVRRVQAEQARHGGRVPDLKAEAMDFDAYMCNDGRHAQEFGKKLTKGIDEVAFPVRGPAKK